MSNYRTHILVFDDATSGGRMHCFLHREDKMFPAMRGESDG
jgi:hypothetical protein